MNVSSTSTSVSKNAMKCFLTPIFRSKFRLQQLKPWIVTTTQSYLGGINDEIVVEYIYELIGSDDEMVDQDQVVDMSNLNEQLCEFLGKRESLQFCQKLWKLMYELLKGNTPDELKVQKKKLELKNFEEEDVYEKEKKGYKRRNDIATDKERERERIVDKGSRGVGGERRRTNYNRSGGTNVPGDRESFQRLDDNRNSYGKYIGYRSRYERDERDERDERNERDERDREYSKYRSNRYIM